MSNIFLIFFEKFQHSTLPTQIHHKIFPFKRVRLYVCVSVNDFSFPFYSIIDYPPFDCVIIEWILNSNSKQSWQRNYIKDFFTGECWRSSHENRNWNRINLTKKKSNFSFSLINYSPLWICEVCTKQSRREFRIPSSSASSTFLILINLMLDSNSIYVNDFSILLSGSSHFHFFFSSSTSSSE